MPQYRSDLPPGIKAPPRMPVRQLVTCADVVAILVGWGVAFGMAVSHGRPHIGGRIVTAQSLTILGAGLLLLSALLVWAHGRGPVLSRQKRIGLDGERFTLFRLRSLALGSDGTPIEDANGAEVLAEPATFAHDPRLTPFGGFCAPPASTTSASCSTCWRGRWAWSVPDRRSPPRSQRSIRSSTPA